MVSVTGEVFKIKDNGRDYKYESLEGARFLPRNHLFLSGITVMVKGGKMARVQEMMKKGPQQSAENRTRSSSSESLRGRPRAQGRLA